MSSIFLLASSEGVGLGAGLRVYPASGPGEALAAHSTSWAGGKAVEGVSGGLRRGPQEVARSCGAGPRCRYAAPIGRWCGRGSGGAAVRQAPPPARGDLRGGGGGERAGLRRRLAGGLPPLGPPRPGRSGSDAASGGLGMGEPAAALGGPGGAQAESLGKGGGWA